MACDDIPVPPWFYYVEQDLLTALHEANEQYVREEEERFKAGPTYNVLGETSRKRKREGNGQHRNQAPKHQGVEKPEQPKVKKPPLSAYQVFMSIRTAEVRADAHNANISAADIRKAVSTQWNGMVSRQRAPYEAEYYRQKDAFGKENPDWKEQAAAAKAKSQAGKDLEVDLGKSRFEEAYREAKRQKKEERQQRLPPRMHKKQKENVFGPRPEEPVQHPTSESSIIDQTSDFDSHAQGAKDKSSSSSKQASSRKQVDEINPISVKQSTNFLDPAKVYPVTAPPSKEQKFWTASAPRPKQAFPARTYSKKNSVFAPRVSKAKLECTSCKAAGLTGPWLHHTENACPKRKTDLPQEVQEPFKMPVIAHTVREAHPPYAASCTKVISTQPEAPIPLASVPSSFRGAETSKEHDNVAKHAIHESSKPAAKASALSTLVRTNARKASSEGVRVSLGSSNDPIDLDLVEDDDDSDVEMVIAHSLVKRPVDKKIQIKREESISSPNLQDPVRQVSKKVTNEQRITKSAETSRTAYNRSQTQLPAKPALKPLSTLVPVVAVPARAKTIKGRSNQGPKSTFDDIKLPSFRQSSSKNNPAGPLLLQKSLDNLNMAKEGFISAKSLLKPSRPASRDQTTTTNQPVKPTDSNKRTSMSHRQAEDTGNMLGRKKDAAESIKPKSPLLEAFDDIEDFASDLGDDAETVPELSASQSKALDALLSDSSNGTDDIFGLFKLKQQPRIAQVEGGDGERSVLTARRPSMQQAKQSAAVTAYSADAEMDAVLSFGQFAYL